MWVIILAIVIFVIYKAIKRSKSKEDEIAAIVEAADNGDPSANAKLGIYFNNGLTGEQYNEIRRKVYLPKALKGDSNAQYWIGLLEAVNTRNAAEALRWWTEAAENGNTKAMMELSFEYSGDGTLKLREDKEKAHYWLVKAAETDPEAMMDLGSEHRSNKNYDEALALYIKAGNIGRGQTKVRAYWCAATTYGLRSFAGYDPEKEKEYLLKALNVKPVPTDKHFNEKYAIAAATLSEVYDEQNKSDPSQSNLKNAAYCAVIAAVLDRDNADKLSEYSFSRSEFDKWAEDARNYNFRLPC